MFRASISMGSAGSSLLEEKWDARAFTMHRQRVRAARSTVDTKQPQSYSHVRSQSKKRQEDDVRFAQIEKDNRKLLEHMTHIMRSKGRVDHYNNYQPRSTNSWKRQMEFDRIARENEEVRRRIIAQKPVYSAAKWEAQNKKHQQLVYMKSRHPRNRGRQLPALDKLPGKRHFPSSSELSFGTESSTSKSLDGRHGLPRSQPLPHIGKSIGDERQQPPIQSIPEHSALDI